MSESDTVTGRAQKIASVFNRNARPAVRQERAQKIQALKEQGLAPGEAITGAADMLQGKMGRLWGRLTGKEVNVGEAMARQEARGDEALLMQIAGLRQGIAMEYLGIADELDSRLAQPGGFQDMWHKYGEMLAKGVIPEEVPAALIFGERLGEATKETIEQQEHERQKLQEQITTASEKTIETDAKMVAGAEYRASRESTLAVQTAEVKFQAILDAKNNDGTPKDITELGILDCKSAFSEAADDLNGTNDRVKARNIDAEAGKAGTAVSLFSRHGDAFLRGGRSERETSLDTFRASAKEIETQSQITIDQFTTLRETYRSRGMSDEQIDEQLMKNPDYQRAIRNKQRVVKVLNKIDANSDELLWVPIGGATQQAVECFDEIAAASKDFQATFTELAKQHREVADKKESQNADVIRGLNAVAKDIDALSSQSRVTDKGEDEQERLKKLGETHQVFSDVENFCANGGQAFLSLTDKEQRAMISNLATHAHESLDAANAALLLYDAEISRIMRSQKISREVAIEGLTYEHSDLGEAAKTYSAARSVLRTCSDRDSLFADTKGMDKGARQSYENQRWTTLNNLSLNARTLDVPVQTETTNINFLAKEKAADYVADQKTIRESLGGSQKALQEAQATTSKQESKFSFSQPVGVEAAQKQIADIDEKIGKKDEEGVYHGGLGEFHQKNFQDPESPYQKLVESAGKMGIDIPLIKGYEAVLETTRRDAQHLSKAVKAVREHGAIPLEREADFFNTAKRKEDALSALEDGAWEDVMSFMQGVGVDFKDFGLTDLPASSEFQASAKSALEKPIKEGRISIFELIATMFQLIAAEQQRVALEEKRNKELAAAQHAAALKAAGGASSGGGGRTGMPRTSRPGTNP